MTEQRPRPYRPALVTLTDDMQARATELLGDADAGEPPGLDSEARVLTWLQELSIRTLGALDELVYTDLARQFRGQQGVLLAALLQPHARRGPMTDLGSETAARLRERLLAHYVYPAHHDAFRRLRQDATEYADEADPGDEHDPGRQTFIAMRPALSELEQWQQRALRSLLEGFADRGAILDWVPDLELATHGELDRDWATRLYDEASTVAMLTGDSETDARARRLFAAYYILPRYRAGVRTLAGRAGELPDAEREASEVQFA